MVICYIMDPVNWGSRYDLVIANFILYWSTLQWDHTLYIYIYIYIYIHTHTHTHTDTQQPYWSVRGKRIRYNMIFIFLTRFSNCTNSKHSVNIQVWPTKQWSPLSTDDIHQNHWSLLINGLLLDSSVTIV